MHERSITACMRAVMPDGAPSTGANNSMIGLWRVRTAIISAAVPDRVVAPVSKEHPHAFAVPPFCYQHWSIFPELFCRRAASPSLPSARSA